jgi:hypothetical protein
VYRPLHNRLTLILEVSAPILVLMAAAGALGAAVSGSGLVAVVAAGAVAVVWVVACLRVALVVTDESLVIANRWRSRVVPRASIRSLEARHMTRGFFGGGGKSFPVVAVALESRDEGEEIKIEVTASARRSDREDVVELLQNEGAGTGRLSRYLDGYV